MADEYIKRTLAKAEFTGNFRDEYPTALIHALIDNVPTADVRPVVRGKWIKAPGSWYTPGGDPVWQCSNCGKGRHVYGIEHSTYGQDIADGQWVTCPNCGADMRKETDDGGE